jgi:hypothetical protein
MASFDQVRPPGAIVVAVFMIGNRLDAAIGVERFEAIEIVIFEKSIAVISVQNFQRRRMNARSAQNERVRPLDVIDAIEAVNDRRRATVFFAN